MTTNNKNISWVYYSFLKAEGTSVVRTSQLISTITTTRCWKPLCKSDVYRYLEVSGDNRYRTVGWERKEQKEWHTVGQLGKMQLRNQRNTQNAGRTLGEGQWRHTDRHFHSEISKKIMRQHISLPSCFALIVPIFSSRWRMMNTSYRYVGSYILSAPYNNYKGLPSPAGTVYLLSWYCLDVHRYARH